MVWKSVSHSRKKLVSGAIAAALMFTVNVSAEENANGCQVKSPAAVLNQCLMCHSIAKKPGKFAGPTLHGIVGSKAAADPSYEYSKAFQKIDWIWDRAKLDAFLKKPRALVPGNKMAFAGISNDRRRERVLCALENLTSKKATE